MTIESQAPPMEEERAPGSRNDRTIPAVNPPSLRVNFGWTLAGHVVYAGCQWALLVVIARLASQEAVGRFALGLAVTAPLFLFAGLQLSGSQASDAARRFTFADYFGVELIGMIAALVTTAAIVAVAGYDREGGLVILAVGLSKAIEGVSNVHYGFLQQHEQMRSVALSLALRGVVGMVAVMVVLWAGGGIAWAVCALAASWLVVLLANDARASGALLRAEGGRRLPRLEWRTASRVVAISLPLGLVLMLISLRTNIPRYFLESRFGASELGVFAALASLVQAGNLVIAALGQSAVPRMARYYHERRVSEFRRLLSRLLVIAVVVGVAGVLVVVTVGARLLGLLFGPVYAAHVPVLTWLMAAGLVAYASSFCGYALTATRRFVVQLPLFACSSLACAAASAVLVPRHGLNGAAWAWGIAVALEFIAAATILRRALRKRADADPMRRPEPGTEYPHGVA